MLKSYKFNFNPNKEEAILLQKHFGACRFIYNRALARKIELYAKESKRISCFELIKELTPLKKQQEFEWLNEIYTRSLQKSIINLDMAFTNFFKRKKGFPKFKSKYNKQSYQYPQGVKVNQENGLIKLPKFKKLFRLNGFRKFEGIIKTTTVSQESDGKYYVSILVDNEIELPQKLEIKKETAIAIDVGIKDFATLSNGEVVANPKFIKKYEKNLAKQQKRLARKTKGSNRRQKQKLRVAKAYKKISNSRSDFQHKLSTDLIKRFDTICVENLNIQGMVKNHNLAKAISDCSWGEFFRMLNYKAEWYGKNILEIGRFEPSSKVCSCCGFVKKDLQLKDRKWQCSGCDSVHDRDHNAAKNILNFAFQKQNLSPSGRGEEDTELSGLVGAMKC